MRKYPYHVKTADTDDTALSARSVNLIGHAYSRIPQTKKGEAIWCFETKESRATFMAKYGGKKI
jgi:hypothetical protein